MARQDSYDLVTPADSDFFTIVDASDTTQNAAGSTKRTLMSSVSSYVLGNLAGANVVSLINTELGSATWQDGGGGGGALAALDTVGTSQIDDNSVTVAKFQTIATTTLMGRSTAGPGNVEILTDAQARALLKLPSTGAGEGADLIGSPALGSGFFTTTTAGEQLQELGTRADALGSAADADLTDLVAANAQNYRIFDAAGDENATRPDAPLDQSVNWRDTNYLKPTNARPGDIYSIGKFGVAAFVREGGASHTLVEANLGRTILMTSASPNTVTIPVDADPGFNLEDDSLIAVIQLGAGQTTINGASGLTINGVVDGSVVINGQRKGAVLIRTGANAWEVIGDIT